MFADIYTYLLAHRAAVVAIATPMLSALLTLIFGARSYDGMSVRRAGLSMALHAVFVDSPKAIASLLELALGATPKVRAGALASLVAAVTIDPPKLIAGMLMLVTGRGAGSPPSIPPAVVGLLGMALVASCTPGQRQTARTVLDVAQVACIVATSAFDDATVAKVCDVADDAIGPMQTVLAETRREVAKGVAAARVGAAKCEAER